MKENNVRIRIIRNTKRNGAKPEEGKNKKTRRGNTDGKAGGGEWKDSGRTEKKRIRMIIMEKGEKEKEYEEKTGEGLGLRKKSYERKQQNKIY
jgi:hypothetical protein